MSLTPGCPLACAEQDQGKRRGRPRRPTRTQRWKRDTQRLPKEVFPLHVLLPVAEGSRRKVPQLLSLLCGWTPPAPAASFCVLLEQSVSDPWCSWHWGGKSCLPQHFHTSACLMEKCSECLPTEHYYEWRRYGRKQSQCYKQEKPSGTPGSQPCAFTLNHTF